ncbi:hypothetical protein [Methylobacterium ajmalii]|uniref:hypothetical protein n=1 Tax=Methylobacterium ajmalii TaxID=2738439 RepID=UPI001909CB57|nr:hypothetical protein [Methylobacterium ajmalii]MBK3399081.1 hypothetical protein [Methylobacterium ajmalii]MBK3412286.1 hypothetical protein [Methylobacterium ajmalii]MBK3426799.1 hypothetical protein [Methylobacterium ajmalii]
MKLAATARLSLALGQPRGVAFGLMRLRAIQRQVLAAAGHEAGRGNVVTAAGLLVLWLVGL